MDTTALEEYEEYRRKREAIEDRLSEASGKLEQAAIELRHARIVQRQAIWDARHTLPKSFAVPYATLATLSGLSIGMVGNIVQGGRPALDEG